MSVQISIVHYAEENELAFNDILVMLVKSIRELTEYPYKLNIIDNHIHPKARRDMEAKLPDVEIIRAEGEYHTFPAGANTAIENMDGDYLALLHTDLIVSWGWLKSLVKDLQRGERKFGVPCVTTPILLPYPKIVDVKNYMVKYHVPHKMWGSIPIAISRAGLVSDNGHQLGVYMASKKFFEEVGSYDETLARFNDKDYGIRALLTGCRSLVSNGVYLHHMGGLHANSGVYKDGGFENFKRKWSVEAWRQVQSGILWIKLHNNRPVICKWRRIGKDPKSILAEILNSPSNPFLVMHSDGTIHKVTAPPALV